MTTTTTERPECRSEQQALAQLETIQLWQEVHSWAEGDEDPKELSRAGRRFLLEEMDWAADPDREAVADAIREMAGEDPLHIQVRSDWHSLGEEPENAEFEILLCTGGPAVRIRGDLHMGEPSSCRLQHQDWFTPWADVVLPGASDALLWYACQFYWGDA